MPAIHMVEPMYRVDPRPQVSQRRERSVWADTTSGARHGAVTNKAHIKSVDFEASWRMCDKTAMRDEALTDPGMDG